MELLFGLLVAFALLPCSRSFAKFWHHLISVHSEYDLAAWGSYTVVMCTFFPVGLFFLVLDLSGYARKYKIQSDETVTPTMLKRLALNLFINFGCIMPLESHLIVARQTVSGQGLSITTELPSPWLIILTISGCGLLSEFTFYYSHRLLHVGPLYRRIHKVHHELKAPIALAAVYAHPLEFGVQNIMPLFFPYLLLRSHLYTFYIGIILNVLGTQIHHCGYRLPPWAFPVGVSKWSAQPNFHDFHHETFQGNYGILGLLDSLHGTSERWQAALKVRGGHVYTSWSHKQDKAM